MKFTDILAPESLSTFEVEFSQLKTGGSVRDIEFQLVRKDGTILPVLLSATSVTGSSGEYLMSRSIVYDMTERRRGEEQLRRVNSAHRALTTCNQALVRATDESALVAQICRIIVEEAGYRSSAGSVTRSRMPPSPYAPSHRRDTMMDTSRPRTSPGRLRARPRPDGNQHSDGRDPVHAEHGDRPSSQRPGETQRAAAATLRVSPFLSWQGLALGALTIYSAETDAFGTEEMALLQELAGDLSYGISSLRTRAERKRSRRKRWYVNARSKSASKSSRCCCSTQPPTEIPGLRVAALNIPSQRIAGDFYHSSPIRMTASTSSSADVMGKGIPAALLGAATKSHFTRALCHLIALFPSSGLAGARGSRDAAHAEMARHLIDLESFVTLCYARWIRPIGASISSTAATRASSICRDRAPATILHGDNLPLGSARARSTIRSPSRSTGRSVLVFSDGITEARSAAGEFFGAAAPLRCVRTNRKLEPTALVEAIRAAVVAFHDRTAGRRSDLRSRRRSVNRSCACSCRERDRERSEEL